MTLKELQQMIKEEFEALQNETEGDDVDVAVSDDDVDVDAEVGDEEEGPEDILRNIYNMLKDRFEAEEEMGDEMGDDEMPAEDDVEETYTENNAADLEEGDGYDGKAGKGGTGYDQKVGGKGGTGYDAKSKALQERFQKLANIIK
tara:strand:+ start:97 stop:531 length:435 start_codon:yes stop_codon:yes gene_type:complete